MSWTDELSNKRNIVIRKEEAERKAYQRQIDSLSSMVVRNLYEVGETLWGRTFYGRVKCKVFSNHYGWQLIERKEFNTDEELTSFVLTVSINREQTFSISAVNKHRGNPHNEVSKDLTEKALRDALINACSKVPI